MKIGRNEKCPCGSGKKYKNCCLPLETQAKAERITDAESELDEMIIPPNSAEEILTWLPTDEELEELEDAGLQEVVSKFKSMEVQIETAIITMTPHRKKINEAEIDGEELLAVSDKLFAEDTFAPLRSDCEALNEAFDKVGYPDPDKSDPTLNRIYDLIVDENERLKMSIFLWTVYPKYVNSGRYLDAFLIERSAALLLDDTENMFSAPVIMSFYRHTYDKSPAKENRYLDAICDLLDLDKDELSAMDENERREFIMAKMEENFNKPFDKEKQSKLFENHPDVEEMLMSSLEQMEKTACELLECEDAQELFLTEEEMEQWLPWMEGEPIGIDLNSLGVLGNPEFFNSEVEDMAKNSIIPGIEVLINKIFTPARIEDLYKQIDEYKGKKEAEGDEEACNCAYAALFLLSKPRAAKTSHFIFVYTYVSLLNILHSYFGEDDDEEDTEEE